MNNRDLHWPRMVHMFPGIVALARNEQELEILDKQNKIVLGLAAIGAVTVAFTTIGFIIWLAFQ